MVLNRLINTFINSSVDIIYRKKGDEISMNGIIEKIHSESMKEYLTFIADLSEEELEVLTAKNIVLQQRVKK